MAAARSRAPDADHEQAGAVGRGGNLIAIEDDRRAGLDRDPAQPVLGRQGNCAGPDRRPIGACLLARFFDFNENAARSFAAQYGAALQQRIGPFDRFDAENEALLHDNGLADIERAEFSRDAEPVLDIGRRLRIRPPPAERTLGRKPGNEQPVRGGNAKSLAFELVDDGRKKPIIAKRAIADAGEQLGRAPIRAQSRQAWPANSAGQHQFGNIVLAQQSETLRGGTEPAPRMRHALDRLRLGRAFKGKNEYVAADGAAGFDEAPRQAAAAGYYAEPTRHSPLWADRWRGSNRRG
jgi:hypothetical protein